MNNLLKRFDEFAKNLIIGETQDENPRNIHLSSVDGYEEVKTWLTTEITTLIERMNSVKKNHGYDLPTNDLCYSEHDVHGAFDEGIDKAKALLQAEISN